LALPTRDELVTSVRDVDAKLVLVEGAGGLLVELCQDGATLRDVARDLSASVLVVVSPGLGTLNHTALTLEALASQSIPCAGLVIGTWPADPGLAEEGNREVLATLAPVRAVLPAGAGGVSAADFESMSASVFDPAWVASLA
jgi:dethiobiotin synthetase